MASPIRKLIKRVGLPRWLRLQLPLRWLEKHMAGWGGRTYIKALLYPFIPLFHHYRKAEWRSFSRWGMHFRYDISNYNEWWAYYNFTDRGMERFLAQLKPGQVVMDIGANVGYITARMAHATQPGESVTSFEPHPTTYGRLTDFLHLNENQLPITAENMGLGHESGHLAMNVMNERHSGANTFLKPEEGHVQTAFQIPIETLDNYVASHGMQRVDAMKIDTEGFEYRVLMGAHKVLQVLRPVLFIELSSRLLARDGRTVNDVLTLLQGHGYQLFVASTLQPVTNVGTDAHFDLLAMPASAQA